MSNVLRDVLPKHKDELVKSLEFNRYHWFICVMSVAGPVFGRFSAVEVHNMVEQSRKNLFLKKKFDLALPMATAASSVLRKSRIPVSTEPSGHHLPLQ